ncbi:DUF3592 domain-containing protein [Streptomyces sp. NPDC051985]|uniref:DUF3592 domain-containing protein n=1 Tax=Streptomyces sp. NPDC051985 TaxID=3155807 RepID=UPI0034317D71
MFESLAIFASVGSSGEGLTLLADDCLNFDAVFSGDLRKGLSMRPGGVIDILGIFSIFLGTGGLILQLNSFWVYRRFRKLERDGVEGEATITRWAPAGGQMRLYLKVCLPEGREADEFEEVMLEPVGSPGDVVAVIYDPERPTRAKTGARKDIDYRAERLAVFIFGYGGLALFVAGIVMVALSRPFF